MKSFKAAAVFFVFVLLASMTQADEGPQVLGAPEMAAGIIELFPRAEGVVTAADGERLTVDIGSADGLAKGMDVFLFRDGGPIIHPVTKTVLGTREEKLGRMVVDELSDKEASGRLAELYVTQVIPGDTARLSTKRTAMLVAQDGMDVDALVLDRLLAELKTSGRFDVLEPVTLPQAETTDGSELSRFASEAGADDVLLVGTSASEVKDTAEVSLALYSAAGERLFEKTALMDVTPEIYSQSVMDYPLVRGDYRDFFAMEPLAFRGKHMGVGDVMGDGRNAIIISDDTNLYVYRFNDRVLVELWRREGLLKERHLDIECADINGNGRDEIYVTSMHEDTVSSYVLEFDGTTFKTIAGPVGLMFRVLEVPGRPAVLLATTKGSYEPYSGLVYDYYWEEGALAKGGEFELPGRIKDPYGFAILDLIPGAPGEAGDGKEKKGPYDGMEIVWIDDSDYVQVLDMEGERIWKSPERYGGFDNFFEVDRKDLALPNVDPRGKVKGALQVVPNDEGGYDVLVVRNIPMTYIMERFRGYTNAEVHSLFWNGTGLEERWSIRNIEGYVAGLYEGGVIRPEASDVLALVEPTIKVIKKSRSLPMGSVDSLANLTADKSSLMVYRTPQR